MNKTTEHFFSKNEIKILEQVFENNQSKDDVISSLPQLDGFLTAIASAPKMIMPSKWIHTVVGKDELSITFEEFQMLIPGLMNHMNSQINVLIDTPEQFIPVVDVKFFDGEEIKSACSWCSGYMLGMEFDDWGEIPEELEASFKLIELHGDERNIPKLASMTSEQRQQSVEDVRLAAIKIHSHYLAERKELMQNLISQRASLGHSPMGGLVSAYTPQTPYIAGEKIGRNEPCPCGSGKKYKKCCMLKN